MSRARIQLTCSLMALAIVLVAPAHAAPETATPKGGTPKAGAATTTAPAVHLAPVSARSLMAHIKFLASDVLEGRDTAARGSEIAARYIAMQLERVGILPAGDQQEADSDKRSYFQAFEVNAASVDEAAVTIDSVSYKLGADFAIFPFSGDGTADGQLVFCGYGITAPEHEYDDYAGVDVRGKIVLVLRGEPRAKDPDRSYFRGKDASRHARFDTKYKNAIEHGAAAMILVNDPLHSADRSMVGVTRRGIRGLHDPSKKAGNDSDETSIPAIFASARLQKQLAGSIDLKAVQAKIDADRRPASRPLGTATLKIRRSVRPARTWNVAGLLRGSDPQLASEYVVLGAHYDHEGLRGDAVMNGANDNASGTAALIGVAEALATAPARPKRSVLFLFFNAEEKGLLGSRYYVEHPLVPIAQTTCMINMDMVGRSYGNTVQIFCGALSPALDRISRAAVDRAGIEKPFYGPPVVIARSDHYPFWSKGIPVLVFHSDDERDYHTPADTIDTLTPKSMERIARAVFYTAWSAAQLEARPKLLRFKRI